MYGHTLFTCPEHSKELGDHSGRSGMVREEGRRAVRLLLEARRQALARETEKAPLPPRPPNNIGHYADLRKRA